MNRQQHKAISNNRENPNQNVCAYAVCEALDVAANVRYLHTFSDVKRAISTRYSCRSVASYVGGTGQTVAATRKKLADVKDCKVFVVHVEGHVLLMTQEKVLIDTDPRTKDRRKVISIYGIRRR